MRQHIYTSHIEMYGNTFIFNAVETQAHAMCMHELFYACDI